jgi:hypothetical protein
MIGAQSQLALQSNSRAIRVGRPSKRDMQPGKLG